MHVIDVNSGNRTKAEDDQEQTALEVNLAAAAEIARQLRLRDMGGIVIVDFIDMRKAQSRQLLQQEMQKLMATDKAKHTILPLTKFGLMQITRQRVRPIAMEETTDVCPTCHGTGKVEPTILLEKKIENEIQLLAEKGCRYVNLRVSPYVAAYLRRGLWSLKMRWMFKYKMRIRVSSTQSVGMIDVNYLDKEGKSLLNN
jgi:ribonuclease G